MQKQSGGNLFDKQDHILLQQVSTRRESSENIQPISITDIEFIKQDKQNDRAQTGQGTSTKTESEIFCSSNKIKQKFNEFGNVFQPQSPGLSPKLQQNNKNQENLEGQALNDDQLSLKSRFKTQARAIALTIQRNQSQDKQTDLSGMKTDLDTSYLNVESNLLKKRARSSQQNHKELRDMKNQLLQNNSINQSFSKKILTNLQKVEVEDEEEEERTLQNIKKTIRRQIEKVLFQMLEATFQRRFKSLTPNHIQLIQDKSYHLYNEEKNNATKKIFKCFSLLQWKLLSSTFQIKQLFKKLILKIPIIQPTNISNICLNILSMVSLISLYFLYSITIFFFYIGNSISHSVEIISLLLVFIDISSKFFVGFYNKGEIVTDRFLIFREYIKSTFIIDFISLLSVLISVLKISDSYSISSAVQSIFFIRIFSSKQSFQRMDHLIHIIGKANNLYQLFKLVLKLIILCHIISISYHITAVIEQRYLSFNNTWLDTLDLNNSNWSEKYVYAFFYAFNTIMLNTSNNLNVIESLFTIIVMCSTIGTFAYIMQSINDILESDNKKKREFKQDLETINQYMRKKNLKKEIQSKVCNFLEYLYEEKGDIKNNKEAIHVLKRLPLNLREDIQQDINQKVIESFQSICNTFSEKIKKKTVQIIEEECFLPNEIIFKQGSFNNQALYLVQKGKENVKSKGDTVTFSVQEKNGIFGEMNFFSGLAFDYQARSGDFTTLYKIPRKEFVEILQSSNDDFEQFCVTRDSILFEKNSPFLQIKCKICESKYHLENNCDKVHFSANTSHTLRKYLFNVPSERNPFQRKLKLRTNAIHFVNQMRDVCDKITSNPEYISILEIIDLDNTIAQYDREDSNLSSEAGSNFEVYYDEEDEEKEQHLEGCKEDSKEEKDDSESMKHETKSFQNKINSNFVENQIIEEREDYEESPLFDIDKNGFIDGFNLYQQSSSTQYNPNFTKQNQSNLNASSHIQNHAVQGSRQGQIQKSNQNIPSLTNSYSNIPQIIPSQSKIPYQNIRNTIISQDDIVKSTTLSSQNTQQSYKISRVQFDDHHSAVEQQKSAFAKRKQKKQKCVIIPKSFSKNYSKNYSEQFSNVSRKININNDADSQFGIFQQLSKANTMLEKQLSQLDQSQSLQLQVQPITQQKLNSQTQFQQSDEIQQQLILFDQIKQNLLEFQKQTPLSSILFSNDFERMKKYRIYFPLGNYTYMISSMNKSQKLLLKNTKKRTHVKTWTFVDKLASQQI